jgi:hypothetical protein
MSKVWPEGTNSRQCTSWPFCALDGLRFISRRQMGFITVHFFFYYWVAVTVGHNPPVPAFFFFPSLGWS